MTRHKLVDQPEKEQKKAMILTHQGASPRLHSTSSQENVSVMVTRVKEYREVKVVFFVWRMLLVQLLHVEVDGIFENTR